MECRTIGYNGVSRWCPNLKWGRRGLWWLDSRQDSEHNVSDRQASIKTNQAGSCGNSRNRPDAGEETAWSTSEAGVLLTIPKGQSLFTVMPVSVSLSVKADVTFKGGFLLIYNVRK
jgi:hypothetical protein